MECSIGYARIFPDHSINVYSRVSCPFLNDLINFPLTPVQSAYIRTIPEVHPLASA